MPSPNLLPTDEKRSLGPVEIKAAATPSYNSIFALQVGVVVIAALYFARDVLIPITVAGLLSFLLVPLVGLLRRIRIGRIASVVLAALLALGILLAIGTVIGTQLAHLLTRLPEYIATVQNKIGEVAAYATDHFAGILHHLGWSGGAPDAGSAAPSPPEGAGAASPADPQPAAPPALPDAISPMTVLTTYCHRSCRRSRPRASSSSSPCSSSCRRRTSAIA